MRDKICPICNGAGVDPHTSERCEACKGNSYVDEDFKEYEPVVSED